MDLLTRNSLLLAGGLAGTWWLQKYIRHYIANPRGLPLPPGPKGYPIIGNLFDFPTHKPWLVYDQWSKTYGDLMYFNVLGQGFLVLGNLNRTYDLFERRSSNYSDRPYAPLLVGIMEWGYSLALIPYGSWWRRHRRFFHDFFHPNVVEKHQPVQLYVARGFLRNVLKEPKNFEKWGHFSFARAIMEIVYGIKIEGLDDPHVRNVEEALACFTDTAVPGRYLVDIFPIMRFIPSWFPGAEWKRKALRWRDNNHEVRYKPWNLIKARLEAGTAVPCMATTLMDQLPDLNSPDRNYEEEIALNTCAVAYVGGSDTTDSALRFFFMAMCLYPEVQKKGQAELDAVLNGRLPDFNDHPSLPYIQAIAKETMRWQLVAPLGLPHMATNSDEYDGYYIPKGTIVIGNAWSILHDPEAYEQPEEFIPDRFLKDGKFDPTVRDPDVAALGFGRRICPGRFFSDNSLFILISHVLSVFDIKPGLDEKGDEIKFAADVTGDILSQPVQFPCRITPRSKAAEDLILNSVLME